MSGKHFRTSSALVAVIIGTASLLSAAPWNLGSNSNAAWYGQSAQLTVADRILAHQLSNGGWRKDTATTSGEWSKATIDNDATTSHIRFLARVFKATNTAKYRTGCEKGIDLFLNNQYSNGGWPQVFGASSGTYHQHITYNDGAMVKVLDIMKDVAERAGDFTFIDNTRAGKAKTAMDKGVDCILKTQIKFTNGKVTAWCQQHNSSTLAPAKARDYELPSVSGSESVGIVNFLKKYQTSLGNGARTDIALAINNAIKWLDEVKIVGKRVRDTTVNGSKDRYVVNDPSSTIWARFYELNTGRPIFVGRDGVIKYALADIEQERRAGYAYYGSWPRDLIAAGPVNVPNQTQAALNGTNIKNLVINDQSRYSSWSIQNNLQAGSKIYGDREFTFTAVPAAMRGAELIRLACDSKDFSNNVATFSAGNSNITVYVGVDTRVTTRPTWLNSGWTQLSGVTLQASTDNVTYNVYSRNYSSGSAVTLGSQGTSSGVVMYTVAVATQVNTSTIHQLSAVKPMSVTVRGRMLNVSSPNNSVFDIRMVDTRGKIVARFNVDGNANLSLTKIPAGRYFAEVRGSGIKQVLPVIVK